MPGTLFVVATPIGNLEDITLRALRVLREVSVIAAEDTRRTAHLLARHAIRTPTTSLHEHNESRKAPIVLARLQRGDNVALVSDAGTPAVSDPGAHLIRSALAAGIRVEAVPGPSAVLTALVASGLPLDQFTFLGFPPIRSNDRRLWFEQLAHVRGTVVFFESPHRISSTLTDLRAIAGDCEIAVGRELTKLHEELVIGPISRVLERLKAPKGEFTIVANIGRTTDIEGRDEKARSNNRSNGPFGPNEGHQSVGSAQLESRRQAVASLARAHGLTANQLYAAIERAKKSGERPT
jgi:16S rRNA (cytidine1402-2'-O)-methyltransferase